MSLDSSFGGGGGGGVGLDREVWSELRVKAQPESWRPPYPLHNTNYFFKLMHDAIVSSFSLVITDLCFVWVVRMEQAVVDARMKEFNPSIRRRNTNHTIRMLCDLLRDNNAQQFHLVKLTPPKSGDEGDADESDVPAASRGSPRLHLESSMSLGGLISFKWHFDLHSYGDALDQCAFLRSHMYLPLHEMIKMLSFQVDAERRKNERLQAMMRGGEGGGAAAGAPSVRGGVAAAAAAAPGDVSLSLDLPSLSTAEREAQANKLLGGGGGASTVLVPPTAASAAAGAPISFDHFASGFHFGQVGDLYVSALQRLSGEEVGSSFGVSGGGGGESQSSFDFPPPSLPPAGEAHFAHSVLVDEDRKRPTAAERRRAGVKRDRSPSPASSAVPRFSAAASSAAIAAAASASAAALDRDSDIDYKHTDDLLTSPSFPPPSGPPVDPSFAPSAGLDASFNSSIDIGGAIDDDGVYRESEAEKVRREMLARQLSAQKKKKKKRAFV